MRSPLPMRRIADLVGSPLAWAAAVALLFGVPLASGLLRGRAAPPPPVLGAFPGFVLRDEQGAPFGDRDLRGRAFVAELLCTRCTVPAALAAETMRALQRRTRSLGDALLLVSFAADADPAALRALQGPQRDLRRVLVSGSPPGAERLFAPEGSLLLVDAALRIRAVYRRDDLDDLLRDAMLVVNAN